MKLTSSLQKGISSQHAVPCKHKVQKTLLFGLTMQGQLKISAENMYIYIDGILICTKLTRIEQKLVLYMEQNKVVEQNVSLQGTSEDSNLEYCPY